MSSTYTTQSMVLPIKEEGLLTYHVKLMEGNLQGRTNAQCVQFKRCMHLFNMHTDNLLFMTKPRIARNKFRKKNVQMVAFCMLALLVCIFSENISRSQTSLVYHTSFTAPDAELQAFMNKMNNKWNVDYYDRTCITQSMTSSLKYE